MHFLFEQWLVAERLVAERKAATHLFPGTDKWEAKSANEYIYELDTALKLIRRFKEKNNPQASTQ